MNIYFTFLRQTRTYGGQFLFDRSITSFKDYCGDKDIEKHKNLQLTKISPLSDAFFR
jgi:hypothetical protein